MWFSQRFLDVVIVKIKHNIFIIHGSNAIYRYCHGDTLMNSVHVCMFILLLFNNTIYDVFNIVECDFGGENRLTRL